MEAEWKGSLSDGTGIMKLGSGAFNGSYSFKSRFESGKGTNPNCDGVSPVRAVMTDAYDLIS